MSNNTESNTSINIKELLYDNQRLSLLVVQLNKKLDSLQKENDKCHELINLLNKSKEEYKMEMKLEKAKIMNQIITSINQKKVIAYVKQLYLKTLLIIIIQVKI